MLKNVIHTFEFHAHADRPTERAHANAEFRLEFVEQIERITSFAVHFVHENHHRCAAHGADLHQFARLCLHTFGSINHNDDAIHGRERAESIFGKILVARRIENVYFVAIVFETHHRSSDRNAALFLDFHPVGCGSFFDFVRFHCARHMNGATEKQQFFGECGLTSIGVRYDGESAPAIDFGFKHRKLVGKFIKFVKFVKFGVQNYDFSAD